MKSENFIAFDCIPAIAGPWMRRSRLGLIQVCTMLALLFGLWAIAPMPSLAQTPPPLSESPPTAPLRSGVNAEDISAEKVSQFVAAYLRVSQLIERREAELQAVETETESLQLQREIEAAAVRIIEDTGLTWQEYVQLLGLANLDPDFGERIAAQLQD